MTPIPHRELPLHINIKSYFGKSYIVPFLCLIHSDLLD